MKIFVSAGEASGDLHASALMEALKARRPDVRFTYLGGDLMERAAGTPPLIHYRRMAYMGFSEVLRHLPDIAANLRTARRALLEERPDAVVLVDYPGFNLKLAKAAWKAGIPVYWYISPKVWAWKEYRVPKLRRYVRRMLCILPFETDYFRSKGMEVTYVGNPSVEEIDRRLASAPEAAELLRAKGIDTSRPLLALVPGSRMGEIRNNLPVMAAVARTHPELTVVIAGAPGIDPAVYAAYSTLPVISGATSSLMAGATAALVTSGTATLECALAATPQVVCYRANGSRLSYNIMKRILHIPFVSLPNLIAGREVIPEMLVHLCTPELVGARLAEILPGAPGREAQLSGYAEIRLRLGHRSAAQTAAETILQDFAK